jgi:predicted DNA-binding transcriptional regulator AlpA
VQAIDQTAIGSPLQELWTIQDVSAFLQVPVGTLYQWRHKGYGPPAWRLGRSHRYDAAEVRRWLLEEMV